MKIKLRNRIETLMKDSGVKSFEEMATRLTENQGYQIGRTSLSRKFRAEDIALTLKSIEAICNELQCLPGDLFETTITEATEELLEVFKGQTQPFRYGSIHLGKGALKEPAKPTQVAPAAINLAETKAKAKKIAQEDDAITGPKVTHLNVGMLKD